MSETPQAVIVATAKAVEARLRNAQLSQRQFTLKRNYATWDIKLETLDGLQLQQEEKLRIDVVSHTLAQTTEHLGHNVIKFVIPVDIAIRKKFGAADLDPQTREVNVEAIDELLLLQQEIILLFAGQLLAKDTSFPSAWDAANGTEIVFAPNRQHLRELNQFTGLVRVHFRASLKIPVEGV